MKHKGYSILPRAQTSERQHHPVHNMVIPDMELMLPYCKSRENSAAASGDTSPLFHIPLLVLVMLPVQYMWFQDEHEKKKKKE